MLIAIEGIDGSGKTTIANYLSKLLKGMGYDVVVLKEPSDSEYGKKLKELNTRLPPEEECKLFLLDRIEDVRNNILPALKSGKIVIMDRYYLSNIAYQSARGLDPEKIRMENEKIAPKPDLTIILDLDPEVALERIKSRGVFSPFERLEYLREVRRNFLRFADDRSVIIDASKSLDEVKREVEKVIQRFLAQTN